MGLIFFNSEEWRENILLVDSYIVSVIVSILVKVEGELFSVVIVLIIDRLRGCEVV